MIVFKSLLLIGLWISVDHFYIGEKPGLAEQSEKDLSSSAGKSESDKSTKPTVVEKRKSFLDNLLNLPDLDPNKLKREEISHFLTLAERKKKQVDERLVMLKAREAQLIKLEDSIDQKLKKLDEERRFFAQTVQQEKDMKGQRLDRLVELYDKMEPKKTAPIFEKMDKDLVVALFKRLKQKQITTVIEFMKPEKSVELTEYFGRIRSSKEFDLLREMNVSLRKEFADCRGMAPPEDPEEKTAVQPAPASEEKSPQGTEQKPEPQVQQKQDQKTDQKTEQKTEPTDAARSDGEKSESTPKIASLAKDLGKNPDEKSAEKVTDEVPPAPISAGEAPAATSQTSPTESPAPESPTH